MRPIFLQRQPRFAVDVLIAWGASIGLVVLLGWNIYELGKDQGAKAAAAQCRPITVYRRAIDQHSPTELRRMAAARERRERVK